MGDNSRLFGGFSQSQSQSLFLSQASQDMYASQDQDYSITPRDNHFNYAGSPARKAKRGRFFAAFAQSQSSVDNAKENDENDPPLFYMSQDSMLGSSQFSQDFSDRLCRLNVQSSQDTNCHDISIVNEDSQSMDGFNISSLKSKDIPIFDNIDDSDNKQSHQQNKNSTNSRTLPLQEKQISIAPPLVNPFIKALPQKKSKRPMMLWITPFKERPRTLVDFEIIKLLGEGVSSTVHSARKRLDGQLYALKKIKRKINSENEGKHVLKEAHAHAALVGCPGITQYFGCWIDDGHLNIQTELCSYGSLDVFVKKSSDNDMSFGEDSQLMSQQSNSDDNSIVTVSPNIPEKFAWLILYKISETLAFMHNKDMAHLDLRPANIFISDPNCNEDIDGQNISQHDLAEKIISGEYVLKLGDLGHTSKLDETNFVEEGEGRYVAKELINSSEKVDFAKADMFSLGATVYEICLGKALGTGAYEWHNLRDGNFDRKFLCSYSKELCDCVTSLMHPLPMNRPSSLELFELLKSRESNVVMASLTSDINELRKELDNLKNENLKLKTSR